MKIGLFDSGIGVIPFINEIIFQNKENDYYIYIDKNNFPYGVKKEEELLEILKTIFNIFEKLKIDELLMLCNTMSYIFLKYQIKSSFKVRTILEYNLQMYTSNKCLLCTSFLSDKLSSYYKVIDGKDIASLIEEEDIYKLINRIKDYDFLYDVILCCTHYSLAKNIISLSNNKVKFYSYEKEFISSLTSVAPMNFYSFSFLKPILEKHLINKRIKIKYF